MTITKPDGDGERVLASLGRGALFGELALIDDSPRFATASADERTRLLIMYKSYFDSLVKSQNSLSSRILMNLAGSLAAYIRRIQGAGPNDGAQDNR